MAESEQGFVVRRYTNNQRSATRYILFVPPGYDGTAEYPLILFLHGAGEAGTDFRRPVKVGLGPAIASQEQTFPFLAIFPQSRYGSWREITPDAMRAMETLDQVTRDYRVDPRRIHLTGISMGGYGTWALAMAYPDTWASIVPICGGGLAAKARLIIHIPCWCFHGDADEVVPVAESRRMVDAVRAAGGNPRYTELPGVGHNSWDPAYATPGLFEWMAAQRKA